MRIKLDSNEERSLCPSGIHNAVCAKVCDLGLQPGYNNGPPRRNSRFCLKPRNAKRKAPMREVAICSRRS